MKDLQRFFYALKRSCSVFMDAMKASDKVKKTGGSFSFMMHPVIDPELNVSGSKSSAAQPGSDSVQSSVVVHESPACSQPFCSRDTSFPRYSPCP
jgi:hypothetical protein